MEPTYVPPKWAGKPPAGYHLDVSKDGKLYQKLMVDEKPYYTFGRNISLADFCIDHASCSRVHAALVYHKHLDRFFLTDLGSTHGSHIGNIRLEPHKPTQLPVDSNFHFGASTRIYTLRERPKGQSKTDISEEDAAAALPESEFELDNLTQNNTLHNRRISMLGITTEGGEIVKPATAMKRKSVTFNEEEDIINPEDVDPTVGRFRNLVQSTIIVPSGGTQSKKPRLDSSLAATSSLSFLPRINPAPQPTPTTAATPSLYSSSFITAKSLGIHLPSPAPDPVSEVMVPPAAETSPSLEKSSSALYDDVHPATTTEETISMADSKKKKYAKEAWPGQHDRSMATLANF